MNGAVRMITRVGHARERVVVGVNIRVVSCHCSTADSIHRDAIVSVTQLRVIEQQWEVGRKGYRLQTQQGTTNTQQDSNKKIFTR